MSSAVTTPRRGAALVFLVASLAAGCTQPGVSAEQLTWCSENQNLVGEAALQLGLIDDPLTFSQWKDNNPNEYERACIEAFRQAA